MSARRSLAIGMLVGAGLLYRPWELDVFVQLVLFVSGLVLLWRDRRPGTAEERVAVETLLDQATVTGVREMYRSGRLPRGNALATIRAILDVSLTGAADILDRADWPPVGWRR